MNNKEIDFIAHRYRKGRFSTEVGWRRLGIASVSRWRRYRAAVAVAVAVVMSASAAILYREYRVDEVPQPGIQVNAVSPLAEVKAIDFEKAPLPEVVKKIESVYDVKVEGVPTSTEGYELSLHYEGTPTDLISVINDILGTEMIVTEK